MNGSYANPYTVAQTDVDTRSAFIRKTYWHLAGSVLAFIVLEAMLLSIPNIEQTVFGLLGKSSLSWLIVLGAFMGGSMLATRWANNSTSLGMQYLGLGFYIALEAVIFLPMILLALRMAPDGDLLVKAGGVTFFLFAALTAIAFTTRKDFSFLGGMLKMAVIIGIGVIVISIIGGFELGILFSAIMCLVAGGYILYGTSNIIHHYGTDQYVAASLELFASVALLFWYVLRIFMSRE
ncbi:Bax inhibitor-1/YccA family protein [Persicirhabdus sediminis]|uniref:Bax inhibitor-1/YccA family protein n=1 Tax=Persicirhabdus sediminis TaxID=454144 RepID=A0A8J7MCQ3_9BACT|nr:Bax inhibitor-1 family protein [Persicirhabdus sediminis]MBK1790671.1 Bax inhibitor-1/YccA family protein [Persicirhabdus sediminis]